LKNLKDITSSIYQKSIELSKLEQLRSREENEVKNLTKTLHEMRTNMIKIQ